MNVQGIPQFNVKNYGAVGDAWYDPSIGAIRGTDDTVAIQNCYNAAAAALGTPGGAGIVYFPPSTGYYQVTTLTTPSVGNVGWLCSLFDNGMYANTVIPGNNNAFFGRTSNLAGLTGSFIRRPVAEWQQPKGITTPLLHIQGGDQIYFEGISFASQTLGTPSVKIENSTTGAGTVYITFSGCAVLGQDSSTQPSFIAHGAFGLEMSRCALGNVYLAMGFVTIEKSFVHSVYYQGQGSSGGDLLIDDVLSEGLTNQNFLTVDTVGGPATDFTLRRVKMADTQGSSYMIKHINDPSQSLFPITPNPANWVVNVKFEMCPQGNIGSGFIDPTSAPYLLSVICEGSDAGRVLEAEGALYDAVLKGPKDALKVYGSRYLNPPFQSIQGT